MGENNRNYDIMISLSFTFMLVGTCIGMVYALDVMSDAINYLVWSSLILFGLCGWLMQLRKVINNA